VDSSLNPLQMLESLLSISFIWDGLKTSLQALLLLISFPSLNHRLLSLILGKVGFNIHVVKFFSNYLVERKTYYFWNNSSSPSFNINVRVGQGLAFSFILSVLYLLPFLHILEK